MYRWPLLACLTLLMAVAGSGALALAQRPDDRVDQAQQAVSERITSQEADRNVTVRFANDARTEFPSNDDVRVRGTGTVVRNTNGSSRPFSYQAVVNTRTRNVTGVQYDWRSAWSRADNRRQDTNRLTGTYRFDPARSDDATTTANRVTQSVPAGQRQRLRNAVLSRLETPDILAIEQNGRNITVASSRAAPVTFDADGREQVEESRNGRRVRTTATMTGNRLVVTTEGDRAADYQITFEPFDNGRSLRITRRITAEDLAQPIVGRSVYNRTSATAQMDVYADVRDTARPRDNRGDSRARDNSTVNDFVPSGTTVVGTLNGDLSTQQAHDEDTFTLTVRSPSQYEGAVITGTLLGVSRSGQVSGRAGMSFTFDTIRARNGRTYPFTGSVESVRATNGDDVRVDTEGQVRDDSSQTERTVTRTGIGAAIGGVIGAITGGGKGAAIGAAVGAGAGAGSVFVQGRNDLDLKSGTEFTIRVTGRR